MFSGKDTASANVDYPTQWALNPSAYQDMDASNVDWAALAQQWIAMKEAAAIVGSETTTKVEVVEKGEAPMDVENLENANSDSQSSQGDSWSANSASWGNNNWNQWGWNWPPGMDPKDANAAGMGPMMDGFPMPPETTPMSGYTTGTPGPTFQHGYWTAPQSLADKSSSSHSNNKGRSRTLRDSKNSRPRVLRDKPLIVPPPPTITMEPVIDTPLGTLDAAKRKQLPAWIREGLEKMEREKQKAIEREQQKREREEAEREKKRLEEEELERLKAEAGGVPMLPPKSKFESESSGSEAEEDPPREPREPSAEPPPPPEEVVKKSREEILEEVMMAVRVSLTEILLEVTDHEIQTVSQEELARYNVQQASRLNALKASKSKALASITSGLGLGAYETSSEESDDEDKENDEISDQQLQELISRRRSEFERTAREIEAEVRRAERREAGAGGGEGGTPDTHTRSDTPERQGSDTPELPPARLASRDSRTSSQRSADAGDARRHHATPDHKHNKGLPHTPSPPHTNNKKSSSSSDSDDDSSTTSSSESEREERRKAKKRKHRSSSDSSRRKYKKQSKDKYRERESKSKRYEDGYEKSRSKRSDEYHEKSHRSRDYDRRDRYREGSGEERRRRRSLEARRRSRERSRHRSRHAERDRHDKYERSRDERRRSRSHSRHRR